MTLLLLLLLLRLPTSRGSDHWANDVVECELLSEEQLLCVVNRRVGTSVDEIGNKGGTTDDDEEAVPGILSSSQLRILGSKSTLRRVSKLFFVCYDDSESAGGAGSGGAAVPGAFEKSPKHKDLREGNLSTSPWGNRTTGKCRYIDAINKILEGASSAVELLVHNCFIPSMRHLDLGGLLRLKRLHVEHRWPSVGQNPLLALNGWLRLEQSSFLTGKSSGHPKIHMSRSLMHSADGGKSAHRGRLKEIEVGTTSMPFTKGIEKVFFSNHHFTLLKEKYNFQFLENSIPLDLEFMHLTNLGIRTLPRSLLCTLPNLASLNLSHNSLSDLRLLGYNVVVELVTVTTSSLSVISNDFKLNVSSDVEFASNAEHYYTTPILLDEPQHTTNSHCRNSLRTLELNHNKISEITSKALNALAELQTLNIESNYIYSIHNNAFEGLHSLELLSLSNNQLKTLLRDTFSYNPLLTKLFLSHNSISHIDVHVFMPLKELLVLDLSHNRLKFGENEALLFNNLRRLVILDLSFNHIDSLWSSMFKGLSSLQRLDLSHNELTSLDAGSFSNMINLYELDISNNRLTVLHSSLFYGLVGLSTINLNNNSITNISIAIFQSVSNLKEVYLRSNNLTEVPKALKNLSFLKNVDMSENHIASIESKSFAGLTNLLYLNLSYNEMAEISSGSFEGISSLLWLDISGNNLENIEENTFMLLTNLEYLKIAKNNLLEINGLFAGMESLLVLDLSQNRINMFDYSFLPRQLLELNLRENSIQKLGNHHKVHDFLKLTKLDVSYNNLTFLKAISLPSAIQVVYLDHNLIRNVDPGTFSGKDNLQYLDLRSNNIQKLSRLTVKQRGPESTGSQLELLLADNPLVCDCHMSWLYASSFSSESTDQASPTTEVPYIVPNIVDVSSSYCSLLHVHDEPNSVTTISVLDTTPDKYLCPYAAHCFATCRCCDYIACDCQMQCPQSCSCFHDDTWNINLVDCSHGNLDRLPNLVPMDATVVYLDGNNLKVLHAHHFIGRHSIQKLFLNSSNIRTLQNRTFHGLKSLQMLHLQDNMIVYLNGVEFSGLRHLKELYLQNNRLSFINNATFIGLKSLEILRIDNNFIVDFPLWLLRSNRYLKSVAFGSNPWDCSCSFVHNFRRWANEFSMLMDHSTETICVFEGLEVSESVLTVHESSNYPCSDALYGVKKFEFSQQDLPLLAGGVCGVLVVISAVVFIAVYINRRKMKKVNKLGVSTTVTTFEQQDEIKIFDVYVSYSAKDVAFVRDILLNRLEQTMPRYKVCLHSQDFAESVLLGEFITQSITLSRRSIIVLSRNYIENEWKSPTFKKNHITGFSNKEFSIITINLDGASESSLDPDLKAIIRKTQKIKWSDNHFWKQLYELLPVRTPTPSMHASSPVYSSDPHYKAPLPSACNHVSSVSSPTSPTAVSTSFKPATQIQPCHVLCTDYIVMQGRDCEDSSCSCKRHPTYSAVDDAPVHTYTSVDLIPHHLESLAIGDIKSRSLTARPRQISVREHYGEYPVNCISKLQSEFVKNDLDINKYASSKVEHPPLNSVPDTYTTVRSLRRTKNKESKQRRSSEENNDCFINSTFDANGAVYRYCPSSQYEAGMFSGDPSESVQGVLPQHIKSNRSCLRMAGNENTFIDNPSRRSEDQLKTETRPVIPKTPPTVLSKFSATINSASDSPNRPMSISQNSYSSHSSNGNECFV